ncbi:hypothetical protein CJD36_020230 [Flavipsychrobacter stenotrophus]|uniref:Uncharacterized protein n=1 Tax=Flavipsychrobacter stenotrophus TaxID=2077091 RepID=A0A2S7SR88_9BACT|nr:hypothetical protein [Flavipsychrobacter stenotrophus]PQJ09127.1 hypothetical protein CJD36_020230 [Flavipsychrobacter stenotrophus]
MINKFITCAVLIIILICGSYSCKKNYTGIYLISDSVRYKQYQIATLTLSGTTFKKNTYEARLNGQIIELSAIGNQLVFITPTLTPGAYSLQTNIDERVFTVAINIDSTVLDKSPNEIIANVFDSCFYRNSCLDSLTQLNNGLLNVDTENAVHDGMLLKQQLARTLATFDSATTSEKLIVAKFIQANPDFFMPLADVISYADTNTLHRTTDEEDMEVVFRNDMTFFKRRLRTDLALTFVGGVIFRIPSAGINQIIGGLLGVSGVYRLYNDLIWSQLVFSKPFVQTALDVIGAHKTTSTSITFGNNQSYVLDINGNYRNICNQDVNSADPLLIDLNSVMKEFKKTWDVVSLFLPEKLNSVPPQFESAVAVRSKQLKVNARYLSIDNISNFWVSCITDNVNGELKVKFNTSSTTNEDFSYNVTYNNLNGNSNTQTFNAKVSTKKYNLVGTWISQDENLCPGLAGMIVAYNGIQGTIVSGSSAACSLYPGNQMWTNYDSINYKMDILTSGWSGGTYEKWDISFIDSTNIILGNTVRYIRQ